MIARMDDVRIGRICRALRRRLGWTQAELATRAGCHQGLVSAIERGHVARVTLAKARPVFAALGAGLDGQVTWRAGALQRLLDARHAALAEQAGTVLAVDGWQVLPEFTYSEFGERGSIDQLALRPDFQAVAVIELKTDLPGIEETHRRHDEKTRLAPRLVERRFGWTPAVVGRILVMPEDSRLRRIVAAHQVTFGASYPLRGREVRAWLREPAGPCGGVWFLSPSVRSLDKRVTGGPMRVRHPRGGSGAARPRSA
jgi:transcriptional regulator with XRE-family HTH domain